MAWATSEARAEDGGLCCWQQRWRPHGRDGGLACDRGVEPACCCLLREQLERVRAGRIRANVGVEGDILVGRSDVRDDGDQSCGAVEPLDVPLELGAALGADGIVTFRPDAALIDEDEGEIFLAHARALAASGRPDEARTVLGLGVERIQFIAGHIKDPGWRARFLRDVPANRALLEMAGR